MVRRYQALGKAKISGRRRMSYLNDAEPMSISVENRTTALAGSTALSRPLRELDAPSVVERPTGTKLTFRDRDRWNLTNSTLTLSESLRSLSASELRSDWLPSRLELPPDFLAPPYGWKMYSEKSDKQPVTLNPPTVETTFVGFG